MGVLVDDLLLLARLDEGRPLERRPPEHDDPGRGAGGRRPRGGAGPPDRAGDGGPGRACEGDDVRLRQVVSNLLSNARSHTPRGAPVTVRVLARERRGGDRGGRLGPRDWRRSTRSGSSSASSAPTPRGRAPAAAAAWACRSSRPSPRRTAGAPRWSRPPGGGPPSACSCRSHPTHRRVPRPPEVARRSSRACQPPPLRSPPPGTRPVARGHGPVRATRAPDRGARPGRPADRGHRRPGLQRGGRPRAERAPPARLPERARFPFAARITIADNASTDGTWDDRPPAARRARRACEAVRLEAKGRGRALRAAWEASDAAVLAYMDVDLSTDLAGLLPLVAPLVSGHSDVAIGTPARPRLAGGARPQARVHLAGLQRAAARDPAHPLQRRAVRLQGDPRRRRARGAAADAGRRLVLRHRDAGARRARGHADPRGPGGLGRRPRQPGQHRRDRPRRPARHRPRAPRPLPRHPAARGSRRCGGARAVPTGWCARSSASA